MLGRVELMKKLRRFLAFVLCAALCFLLLTGCGSRDTIRFKMIAELNQEEFCVCPPYHRLEAAYDGRKIVAVPLEPD